MFRTGVAGPKVRLRRRRGSGQKEVSFSILFGLGAKGGLNNNFYLFVDLLLHYFGNGNIVVGKQYRKFRLGHLPVFTHLEHYIQYPLLFHPVDEQFSFGANVVFPLGSDVRIFDDLTCKFGVGVQVRLA